MGKNVIHKLVCFIAFFFSAYFCQSQTYVLKNIMAPTHIPDDHYVDEAAINLEFADTKSILYLSNLRKFYMSNISGFCASLNYTHINDSKNLSLQIFTQSTDTIKNSNYLRGVFYYNMQHSPNIHVLRAGRLHDWISTVFKIYDPNTYYYKRIKLNGNYVELDSTAWQLYNYFPLYDSKLFIYTPDRISFISVVETDFYITDITKDGNSIKRSLMFNFPLLPIHPNGLKGDLGYYDAGQFISDGDIIYIENRLYCIRYNEKLATRYQFNPEMSINGIKFKDGEMFIYGLSASGSSLYLLKLNKNLQITWSKKIDLNNVDLSKYGNLEIIEKDNKNYLFLEPFYWYNDVPTIIIECDDVYNPLVTYSLPYYVSDVKLSQDTFYIAGNYLYKGEHTPYLGYLFMDNRGTCTLDTACYSLDTDYHIELRKIDSSPLLPAPQVTLENYIPLEDSIEFELQARNCPTVPENKAIFSIPDTVCDFLQVNPYLQDSSSTWYLYRNNNLVDQDTGSIPHFTHYTPIAGTYVIDHIVYYAGCKYRHSDSTFLSSHYGSINSSLDKLCVYDTSVLTFTHSGQSSATSVKWFTYSGNFLGSGDSIHISKPGKYVAQLQNKYCQWTDSIAIQRQQSGCTASVYIPNAFTPNNDNTNDVWKLFSNQVINADIEIYDRWGECVYTCTGTDCAWNGTFKHEQMPEGVYVYRIEATLPQSEKVIKRTGTLVLLR